MLNIWLGSGLLLSRGMYIDGLQYSIMQSLVISVNRMFSPLVIMMDVNYSL
jgi:hypothetical protein